MKRHFVPLSSCLEREPRKDGLQQAISIEIQT